MSFPIIVPNAVPVYRGDDTDFFTYTFESDGTPVDLSGKTWVGTWRAGIAATESLSLTVDASQAANGIIHVSASAEVTDQMESKGVWDVQATDGGDGKITTYLVGTTTWRNDVSRSDG